MSEASVNSPPSPSSPITESFKKYLLDMDKLTDLNYLDWLRTWNLVLKYEGKSYLIENPLPIIPPYNIAKKDEIQHDFLIDESKDVRCLMLLTIDPEIRGDFEFLGSYEIACLLVEKFQESIRKERSRIFKELERCKLEEGSSIGEHVLKIEGYIGELNRMGHPTDWELSTNIILDSLTSQYDLFI